MADRSELEELLQAFSELNERLQKVEEICASTKALDHKGIAMVAAEGLAGGGTINKSRAFKFNYPELTKGKLRLGDELFCVYSPDEGEHQSVALGHLVEAVGRLLELDKKLEVIRGDLKALAKKVELFSFFDRLAETERLATELKEKFDAQEAEREAEAQAEAETLLKGQS